MARYVWGAINVEGLIERRGTKMKCGNCKLWVYNVQPGMTVKDKKKEFKLFGKALGFCRCRFGNNYPMFNFEQCPKLGGK